MRYLTIIALMLLFIPNQEMAAQERFRGGLVLGGNLSQLDGDLLEGYNQIGLLAGAQVATVFSDRWELSIGILYSQKGSNRTTGDFAATRYDNIRLNVIEAPVLVQFNEWKFQLLAGIIYGNVFSTDIEAIDGSNITDDPQEAIVSNSFSYALGLNFYFTENLLGGFIWSRSFPFSNLREDENGDDLFERNIAIRLIYEL